MLGQVYKCIFYIVLYLQIQWMVNTGKIFDNETLSCLYKLIDVVTNYKSRTIVLQVPNNKKIKKKEIILFVCLLLIW